MIRICALSPVTRSRQRLIPTAALLLVVFLSQSVLGQDDIRLNDAKDSDAFKTEFLKHRFMEADRKASLGKNLLAAEKAMTPNQALYDVHYYDLDLTLDIAAHALTGIVTTSAEVIGTSISTMDLDLRYNMNVTGITVGGTGVTFARAGDVLTADLDRAYLTGETVDVTVSYNGNPASESFGWSSHNSLDMVWTLSEPFGARFWWPCKDLNSDKADSVSIRCTVAEEFVVASNGLLLSDTATAGQRTFHWKSNYPIATYLVSLAIYPYHRYSDWYIPLDGGDPMEVQYFVYPDHVATVQPTYDLTVPMIGHFAQGFGEYPFVNEKYGHAEFVWGGGMEHQTITSMGGWSEDLISHELAHQWWGDMVTCDDFGHVWLNEGFATWSEAYWAEQAYGWETYQQYMTLAAYYGPGTIFVEDTSDFGSIFNGNLSYNKGSWIVHMLRGVLGDADFFAGLELYRANHEYGSATTEELRDALESVSGKDLDAFFQQWIYGEYFPVYELDWTEGAGPGEILVTINQSQANTGLFTMPVELRIETDAGTTDITVQNSLASETYTLTVPGTVTDVALDPDHWILCQVNNFVGYAALDQGVLLVNGVQWSAYGEEITSAYADSTFWGDTPITFWDCFGEPSGGYPANLPTPVGHGAVPSGVIGDYSTVIWVGNGYGGDLALWTATPILSYLEAGGNVLLMTRYGSQFLDGPLTDYLGVVFGETNATLANCVTATPGLVAIPFTGPQSYNDVFQTAPLLGNLMFQETISFAGTRGTGAWIAPPGGGTFRADGGRLAYIAGRPYRMDHGALRQNVEYILENFLLEPYPQVASVRDDANSPPTSRSSVSLGPNFPNPFNPQTVVPFRLARAMSVTLDIYDARGRLVRRLAEGAFAEGDHRVRWDGTDNAGQGAASGNYFARLLAGDGSVQTRGMVLIR
jgi:Peptidase family M1 domain/FlgD Ig-like domain/Peptidase M1 N-terminal domain